MVSLSWRSRLVSVGPLRPKRASIFLATNNFPSCPSPRPAGSHRRASWFPFAARKFRFLWSRQRFIFMTGDIQPTCWRQRSSRAPGVRRFPRPSFQAASPSIVTAAGPACCGRSSSKISDDGTCVAGMAATRHCSSLPARPLHPSLCISIHHHSHVSLVQLS